MNRGLAEPILLLLDRELHVVEADAAIRRLHLRAHGLSDGPIALPQIAALARMAMAMDTRIARSLTIADNDSDIAIWAEARPRPDGVEIAITSWRERPAQRPQGALARAHAQGKGRQDRPQGFVLQLDSSLTIIGCDAMPDAFGQPVGLAIGKWLRFSDADQAGKQDFLQIVAERQAFVSYPVVLRESGLGCTLSGRPLFEAADRFAGYLCDLVPSAAQIVTHKPDILSHQALDPKFMAALRQPVGRILANAETISGRLRGALRQSYAGYAGDIVDAAQHLRALIDDMSDLEAIERPGFAPEPDAIDLADLGRRAAGLLAVKASDHQMRIEAPGADISVPATGEFRRVLQILVNLVTNAIRYSPDGSTVRIETRREGSRAQIRVIDQGSGVADEDRERIFEKFERLGRSGDGGSGLGLYISRRIAKALDGSLGVEASGPGGTTFLLDLPARD